MAEYSITFARSARKELERLDTVSTRRVFARIESLSQKPRPQGCLKLQGEKNLWRIRIGDYRVIYSIDDEEEEIGVRCLGAPVLSVDQQAVAAISITGTTVQITADTRDALIARLKAAAAAIAEQFKREEARAAAV